MQILNLYHVYDCSFNFLYTQALSASGLRALRYAREVEGIGHVVALDNDKGASRIFHYIESKVLYNVYQFFSIDLEHESSTIIG